MIIETAILGEIHRKRKLSNTHHIVHLSDEKNSGNQAIGVVHYRTLTETNIAFRKLTNKARKISRDQAQRLLIGLAEGAGVEHECFAFDWLQTLHVSGVSPLALSSSTTTVAPLLSLRPKTCSYLVRISPPVLAVLFSTDFPKSLTPPCAFERFSTTRNN